MAWKESVIKMQPHGVTKRETGPRFLQRPLIIWNASGRSIVTGGYDNRKIYNTLLTSVRKYNNYQEDSTAQIKAEWANKKTLLTLCIQSCLHFKNKKSQI